MAMKDFQSIQVAPGEEDNAVRLWMSFGWELKNKQRVKTQDVQKYAGQNSDKTVSYYETTKGVDFFELTFERDPERKNYAELKALEEQYYTPLPGLHATPPGDKPDKPGVFSLISLFVGVSILLARIGGWTRGVGYIVVGLIFSLIGIRGIMQRKSFSSRLKAWEAANEVYQTQHSAEEEALSKAKQKRTDALERARSLV